VAYHQVDYDWKNARPVALCFAGEDDLQALMVSAGWGQDTERTVRCRRSPSASRSRNAGLPCRRACRGCTSCRPSGNSPSMMYQTCAKSCLCNGNPAPVPELRLQGLDNYVSAPAPAQGDGHARPSA
jgi:hypothetical protein